MMHCQVGRIATVHTQHADELPVAARIAAQAHEGIGNRQIEHLGKLSELRRCTTHDHAATGVNDRTLGSQQKLCRFANLTRMPTNGRAV